MATAAAIFLIACLPGALILRVPAGDRSKRAALPADERLFWTVVLSVAWSSAAGLALAAGGWYRFDRLLSINAGLSLVLMLAFRRKLRLGAARWTPAALVPLALLIAASWLVFRVPPAEYIIGGKDPGIYVNEGIRIAQRGGMVARDDVVATLPPRFRSLFFPVSTQPGYYSNRFMGFFLLNPDDGAVVGQFPHLYPLWTGIAYNIGGLSGARRLPTYFALLGVLAVYFAGARISGRAAAAAAAILLAANVVEVWYARYPNAEILLQPLVFAGLLAFGRGVRERDSFFAPVSAVLFVLGAFTHLTGVVAVAGAFAAGLLAVMSRERTGRAFWILLTGGTAVALVYLWRYIPPYFAVPVGFVENLRPVQLALAAAAAAGGVAVLRAVRRAPGAILRQWLPAGLVAVVWLLAGYALFFRASSGSLAAHDADSLRTFTAFYLTPAGLAAALAGLAVVALSFETSAALLLVVSAFAVLFFYKIRIVPEHFWAARRFLAVVLPGACLLAGAGAFGRIDPERARWAASGIVRLARYGIGAALLAVAGWQSVGRTAAILHHVEYAGLIPHVEQLAATFGDNDLVVVESRAASDAHVLALPLAYIYGRHVLVFAETDPAKDLFREFLTWARTRYGHVYFMGGGGGGTELLSRSMSVKAVRGERFQVPEYESAWNAYPRGVRRKEFDLSVYEFLPHPGVPDGFSLDVGSTDDLYVRRFYAKEQTAEGRTFRWTRDISFVSLVGMRAGDRTLTLWMDADGRPSSGGPADVEAFIGDDRLGSVTVAKGLAPYRFAIDPALAARMAASDDAAPLRLVTRTWNPARLIGGGDDRDLGVMLDRVEVQ
ncbi:MAG TPA: hypothetical protein VL309_04725 [Vicinamibacterales bacterium]|nr:hypothetical protein [Vicinamibacterales bacterium]